MTNTFIAIVSTRDINGNLRIERVFLFGRTEEDVLWHARVKYGTHASIEIIGAQEGIKK